MKIKYPLLEIDKELKDEREVRAFIRGLCDELFLAHSFLTYYTTVSVMNTAPTVFTMLRSSIEGIMVEWILTGKDMTKILFERRKKYEAEMRKVGFVAPENVEVA